MELKSIWFAICGAFLFSCARGEDLVPVYMWETSRTSDSVPALAQINAATFTEILAQKSSKDPFIVVFAEQTLSPEDFIASGSVKPFQHLAKLTDKVSYLPLVERPVEIVKEIPYRDFVEVSIKAILDSETLPPQRILIVNLNDAREDEDRIDMLERHDENIVAIYNRIAARNKKVLAIYTAYQSSWVVPEQSIRRHSRSLMAKGDDVNNNKTAKNDTNANGVPAYFHSEKLMVYLTNDPKPSFHISGQTDPIVLTNLKMTFDNVSVATINSAEGYEIAMAFYVGESYWQVIEVNVTKGDTTYALQRLRTFVPKTFSYHCINARFADLPDHKDTSPSILSLPGLQMQFFDKKHDNRFGDSYDCVGFTTTPIWSGLFITFIMVLILTAGLIAMMDIKTMDRFDDPKGKTIIINANE